jgi:Fur family ferric uptake transcriptional regulator
MRRCDEVLHALRSRGERVTIQRRLVIEALCEDQGHRTVGDIRAAVSARNPEADLPEPTIYRILQWLKDLALISQTDMGGVGVVYEMLTTPHHHLVCLSCGAVADIDDGYFAELRERLQHAHAFAPRIEHMAIYGTCRACSQSTRK